MDLFGKRRHKGQDKQPWNQRLGKTVFSIGIVSIVVYGLFTLLHINADALYIVVPGSKELQLEKAGQYVIFSEYRSEVAGKSYDTALKNTDIELTITAQNGGEPVNLVYTRAKDRYDSFFRAGYSLYSFIIDRPGAYVLTCRYVKEKPEAVLAVSSGFGTSVTTMVLVIFALVIFTGGITAALYILPGRKTRQRTF